jgi:uncharacterized membrane protein
MSRMPLQVDQKAQGSTGRYSQAPFAAKFAVLGAVAVLLIGAVYLMTVRGEALLLDLSQLAGRVWCF